MNSIFDYARRLNDITAPEAKNETNNQSEIQQPQVSNLPEEKPLFSAAEEESLSQAEEEKRGTKQEEPSGFETARDFVGGLVARGLEGIAGLPAKIKKEISDTILDQYERASIDFNKPAATGEKVREAPEALKRFLKGPQDQTLGGITEGKTPEELHEKTKEVFGERFEPKTPFEKRAQDIVSEATELALPFGKNTPIKALFTSAGANYLADLGEGFGLSKESAQNLKLGAKMLGSMISQQGLKGAENFANSKYAEARSHLPGVVSADAKNMVKNLKTLRNELTLGTGAASETFVIDEIDKVLKKVQGGRMTIQEAVASKRSLNEKLSEFLYKAPDKTARARARNLAPQIHHELSNIIGSYGKTNPKFYSAFKEADQAFGTVKQSEFLTNWVKAQAEKMAPHTAAAVAVQGMFNPSALLPTAIQAGKGAAIGYATLKGSQVAYQIYKSPVLRKYYAKVLRDAALQDSLAIGKHLKLLGDKMQEDPEVKRLLKSLYD